MNKFIIDMHVSIDFMYRPSFLFWQMRKTEDFIRPNYKFLRIKNPNKYDLVIML